MMKKSTATHKSRKEILAIAQRKFESASNLLLDPVKL